MMWVLCLTMLQLLRRGELNSSEHGRCGALCGALCGWWLLPAGFPAGLPAGVFSCCSFTCCAKCVRTNGPDTAVSQNAVGTAVATRAWPTNGLHSTPRTADVRHSSAQLSDTAQQAKSITESIIIRNGHSNFQIFSYCYISNDLLIRFRFNLIYRYKPPQ